MKEDLLREIFDGKAKTNLEENKEYSHTKDKVTNRKDKREENSIEIDNKNNNNNYINEENFFNFSLYNNVKNSNNEKLEKFQCIEHNTNFKKEYNEVLGEKNYKEQQKTISSLENEDDSDSPKSNGNKNKNKLNNNLNISNHKKKKLKIKLGDWICFLCQNLNFSFRTYCNRCGISKELSEYKKLQLALINQQKKIQLQMLNRNYYNPYIINKSNNNKYLFNSNFGPCIINVVYCPVICNNYYFIDKFRNYNNYKIYNPCNVNIK